MSLEGDRPDGRDLEVSLSAILLFALSRIIIKRWCIQLVAHQMCWQLHIDGIVQPTQIVLQLGRSALQSIVVLHIELGLLGIPVDVQGVLAIVDILHNVLLRGQGESIIGLLL